MSDLAQSSADLDKQLGKLIDSYQRQRTALQLIAGLARKAVPTRFAQTILKTAQNGLEAAE